MIRLENIHKSYGSFKANDGVSLSVGKGSIHALLGENGAGKSTLMKILSGFVPKTSGRIIIRGKAMDFTSPVAALHAGVGMLYQEPLDFPQLTVLENLMIGRPSGFFLSQKRSSEQIRRISDDLGFSFDYDAFLNTLTLGERQQLEIVRLISLGVDILILDEPTTGISDAQKSALFSSLKTLAAKGKSVILVSHKLDDVMALCDEATVLRMGKVTGRFSAPFDSKSLLSCMFPQGDTPEPPVPRQLGPVVTRFENIRSSAGRITLKPLSLSVHQSEIIGLAGLEGSGQELFLRTAAGIIPLSSGTITLNSIVLSGKPFRRFPENGVFFIPGSRLEEGLIPGLSITDHVALNRSGRSFFHGRKAALHAERSINTFAIKGKPGSLVNSLSGGNQQRFLLSLLPENPRVLLLENPTRGLDHDSTAAVWSILTSRCQTQGTAVIFSSPDLDEILQVADRILVFSNGERTMNRPCREVNKNRIGLAIAGEQHLT